MISQDRLKELLEYDPDTGIFKWRVKRYRCNPGQVAGYLRKGNLRGDGYITIQLEGKAYLAHRLAFMYMIGKFPDNICDHINGDKSDNRWYNLRECSYIENGQNKARSKTNKSGYLGVSWKKSVNKWISQITYKRKVYHLGYFDDPHEAYLKYLEHKKNLHEFNPTPRENGA